MVLRMYHTGFDPPMPVFLTADALPRALNYAVDPALLTHLVLAAPSSMNSKATYVSLSFRFDDAGGGI